MSTEAVVRFRTAVNGSEALKSELRGLGTITPSTLAGLAARHGFEFTPQELNSVADNVWDELTEFELEMVTGGTQELICPRASMKAAEEVAPLPAPSPDDDESC